MKAPPVVSSKRDTINPPLEMMRDLIPTDIEKNVFHSWKKSEPNFLSGENYQKIIMFCLLSKSLDIVCNRMRVLKSDYL